MQSYAGIELGGTKTVVGLVTANGELLGRVQIPTRNPSATLADASAALDELAAEHGDIAGLGIGAFGPVHVNPASPHYGHLGRTPKLAWADFDVLGYFAARYAVPVALDTDVGAAARGEAIWGAAQDASPAVYVTVGTGVGAGILVDGRPVHGLLHPEVGHIRVPRAPGDDYAGSCPHHGDCIEGLVAGPSIIARWGSPLNELPDDHVAWAQISHYLGHLISNVILFVSPQRIVLGGGVLSNAALYPEVRGRVLELLNAYVSVPEIIEQLDELVVPPALGSDSGVLGAAAMAMAAAAD